MRRSLSALSVFRVAAGVVTLGGGTFLALVALGQPSAEPLTGRPDRQPGEELVLTIQNLAAYRVPGLPRVVRVVADGTVRTVGFSRAKLLPFPGKTPPADGVYEFAFTVVPPRDQAEGSEKLTPVDVAFHWYGAPDNAAGIRVRAAANVLETRIIPPTREELDLVRLIGRRLVTEKGEAKPGDIVPADLPEPIVVVHPGEDRPTDQVPERLLLVVDGDGVILEASFG